MHSDARWLPCYEKGVSWSGTCTVNWHCSSYEAIPRHTNMYYQRAIFCWPRKRMPCTEILKKWSLYSSWIRESSQKVLLYLFVCLFCWPLIACKKSFSSEQSNQMWRHAGKCFVRFSRISNKCRIVFSLLIRLPRNQTVLRFQFYLSTRWT